MTLPESNWMPIPCWVADVIRTRPDMHPNSSRTDLSGEFGDPCVYTEWGLESGEPRMREWRYPSPCDGEPDLKPCEHLAVRTTL